VRTEQRLIGVVELAWLRVLMPRWFSRMPLDALLASQPRAGDASTGGLAAIERDVLRVEGVLTRVSFVPGGCLYRALARYALLCRRGYAASFVLGIDARGVEQPGHAWVEVGSRPFAEAEDVSRYRVTFRYPTQEKNGSLQA
jgi:hypothetical protein